MAANLRLADAVLLHALYRLTCPDVDTLLAYAMGSLPETEREQVRKHVQECKKCQAEVEKR